MPAFVVILNNLNPALQLKKILLSTSSHSIWRREPIPNVVKRDCQWWLASERGSAKERNHRHDHCAWVIPQQYMRDRSTLLGRKVPTFFLRYTIPSGQEINLAIVNIFGWNHTNATQETLPFTRCSCHYPLSPNSIDESADSQWSIISPSILSAKRYAFNAKLTSRTESP